MEALVPSPVWRGANILDNMMHLIRREREERALASGAESAVARISHLALARAFARRIRELRSSNANPTHDDC